MTQEEKAKAYDEAFRIAQELYNNPNSSNIGKGYVCTVFPELKESEDERIRKWLICYFKDVCDNVSEKEKKGVLVWLDKQGEQRPSMEGVFVNVDEVRDDFMQEVYRILDADPTNDRANQIIDAFDHLSTSIIQKPTDKTEPKFKVGDFIRNKKTGKVFYIDHSAEVGFSLADKDKNSSQGYLSEDEYDNYDIVEQKPAWSEEDEKEVTILEAYICSKDWSDRHIDRALGIVYKLVNKVKSLRPLKQWKPSDEQIKALHDLNLTGGISYAGQGQTLIELYNDLKKLKG